MTIALSDLGISGKSPAQADFVRVGARGALVVAFERWLEEAETALRRGGEAAAGGPLSFVFRGDGVPGALVGALAPSGDAVGRAFPLAVYGVADGPALAGDFPLIPMACAGFLAAAADLVEEAARRPELVPATRLAELPRPTPADTVAAAETARVVLAHAQLGDLVDRLFPGPAGQHLHGVRTVVHACAAAAGRPPARGAVTLDVPVRAAVDRLAWLELIRRLLGWTDGPPTLAWADAPAPRLLVALGPAPAALLDYFARPDHDGAKLWRVITDRPDAIDDARRALAPAHRGVLERREATLESVLTTLAARP